MKIPLIVVHVHLLDIDLHKIYESVFKVTGII